MFTAQYNDSLAETGKTYLLCQVRPDGKGLKVQIAGEPGNRPYGFTATYEVPEGVASFIAATGKAELNSLADSGVKYVRAQVVARAGNEVHFQVQLSKPGNRDYGLSFSITQPQLAEYVRGVLTAHEE